MFELVLIPTALINTLEICFGYEWKFGARASIEFKIGGVCDLDDDIEPVEGVLVVLKCENKLDGGDKDSGSCMGVIVVAGCCRPCGWVE